MTPVTPFSAALRERSSNAHSGSEHAGFMSDLVKGEGTREDYIALVAQHWFMYDAIERAAEVIADTNGVERIFNQIRLASKAGIATQASDTWISSRVRMKLIADDQVDATDIQVVTENGEVFLLGIVDDSAADRAVDIARNIDGVQKVVKAFSRAR